MKGGVGEEIFYLNILIGNPAKEEKLILDTQNYFSIINCQSKNKNLEK
jgi:hypothetical protein